jgi:hypothetical protein
VAGWETLQDIGAFNFDSVVGEVNSLFQVPQGLSAQNLVGETLTSYDLTMLGAAALRVAVLEQSEERPQRALEVQPLDGRVSFLKFACAMTNIHWARSAEDLRLWDIAPFSGDIAKFGAVGVASATDLMENFDDYFNALLSLYRQSQSPLTRTLAENGWLHLESLVWRTTLYRIADPARVPEVAGRHVARYNNYFGYLGPGLPA